MLDGEAISLLQFELLGCRIRPVLPGPGCDICSLSHGYHSDTNKVLVQSPARQQLMSILCKTRALRAHVTY